MDDLPLLGASAALWGTLPFHFGIRFPPEGNRSHPRDFRLPLLGCFTELEAIHVRA